MDEEELEQPRKKITISNFFESIQSIDKVANRALKKTNSNLGIINNNKSLIEALSKSFNDIIIEVKEIKEYITIKDLFLSIKSKLEVFFLKARSALLSAD